MWHQLKPGVCCQGIKTKQKEEEEEKLRKSSFGTNSVYTGTIMGTLLTEKKMQRARFVF
jgi:hypothetical protein